MKQAHIVYCSPAGSTAHVARVIADTLREKSITVHLLDLGSKEDRSGFMGRLAKAGADDCLFVGAPVYRDVAAPPVSAFLAELPAAAQCMAVPFVTWGGATSGIALWQMGGMLEQRGYRLVGAAKVVAVHCMMWKSDAPVGQGHPDAADDQQVRRFVDVLAAASPASLPLSALDYQPEKDAAEFKQKIGAPWMIVPKTIDEEACTQCGTCEAVCPVGAVTLDPGPVFDQTCFDCFSCIRECPEEAITPAAPLEKIATNIRERAAKFNERPLTQVFVG